MTPKGEFQAVVGIGHGHDHREDKKDKMDRMALFKWKCESVSCPEGGRPKAGGSLSGLKEHQKEEILGRFFLSLRSLGEERLEHLNLFGIIDSLVGSEGVGNIEGERGEPEVRNESCQAGIISLGPMNQESLNATHLARLPRRLASLRS